MFYRVDILLFCNTLPFIKGCADKNRGIEAQRQSFLPFCYATDFMKK
jgi:hypothetical protein